MSIAFSSLHGPWGTTNVTRKAQHASAQAHAYEDPHCRPYGMTGTISASPWEGLYLECPEESVEPAVTPAQVNSDLERFLTALMVGE